MFLETVGAVCIILGLFTRFFAAALAIEMTLITFIVSCRAVSAEWNCRSFSALSSSQSRCVAADRTRSTASSAAALATKARQKANRTGGDNGQFIASAAVAHRRHRRRNG
jgi:hypothetical protein